MRRTRAGSFNTGITPPPPYVMASPFQITANLLAAIGKTQVDVDALPLGIKDCASWLVSCRAVDNDRIGDTVTPGVSGDALLRDFNGVIGENTNKWTSTEATEGSISFSREDTLQKNLKFIGFKQEKKILHQVLARDGFHPAWIATKLASTPTEILRLINSRINQLSSKYPNDDFYRIDVVNEICNSQSGAPAVVGWRTSVNAFYTASRDTSTLATVLGGNSEKWIWDAFSLCRAAWPSAKLAWTDFKQEICHRPDSPNETSLTYPDASSLYDSTGAYWTNSNRAYRQKYEMWRMKEAGVPVDVFGFQLHVDLQQHLLVLPLRALLADLNRFGILPAITEFNVMCTANNGTTGIPTYLQPAPLLSSSAQSPTIQRIGARLAYFYIKEFLTNSPTEEVSFWSQGLSANNDGQTSSLSYSDTPIRIATMLAIKEAQAPASRVLKRGHRQFSFRSVTDIPPWINQGGATFSSSSRRISLTAGGAGVNIPWAWFNAGWMTRPISNSHLILGAQINLAAAPADNSVVIGYGNTGSGVATNKAMLTIMANRNLVLTITVGGVSALTQVIGVVALNTKTRIQCRINGTSIDVSINGGAVSSYSASSSSFSDQSHFYILTNADGSNSNSNIGLWDYEIQHGLDYPDNNALMALSTVSNVDNLPGVYLGD
jgi:GH35 family endo-1,4-beta-xylanase